VTNKVISYKTHGKLPLTNQNQKPYFPANDNPFSLFPVGTFKNVVRVNDLLVAREGDLLTKK
jgi:hypothetical protein